MDYFTVCSDSKLLISVLGLLPHDYFMKVINIKL